jgi:sugar phosphate isomerase/epimerase
VMAEVGEGNLNWPGILAACKEANVEWYAVEQDICPGDPFESLAISYRNLAAMGLS